jgi:hypothetical protein
LCLSFYLTVIPLNRCSVFQFYIFIPIHPWT